MDGLQDGDTIKDDKGNILHIKYVCGVLMAQVIMNNYILKSTVLRKIDLTKFERLD